MISLAETYHFLIISCMCFARCKLLLREGQSHEGPQASPGSPPHTCTEGKSPEAQAPRIAAPTRTDSTSCDRTAGMPVQDEATIG